MLRRPIETTSLIRIHTFDRFLLAISSEQPTVREQTSCALYVLKTSEFANRDYMNHTYAELSRGTDWSMPAHSFSIHIRQERRRVCEK